MFKQVMNTTMQQALESHTNQNSVDAIATRIVDNAKAMLKRNYANTYQQDSYLQAHRFYQRKTKNQVIEPVIEYILRAIQEESEYVQ